MVKIITDSTCDISPRELESLGVEMLPLTVTFGDKTYLDGVELSAARFYELLEQAEELPQTSQVNPARFEEAYRRAVDDGYDVVSIHISKELSGTLQSAAIAAYLVDRERIFCVDGCSASFGLALIVRAAVRLRDEGLSAREIAERCSALAKRSRIIATISTLKYLKMGGRLSGGTAFIGGILGIKLVAEVRLGKVSVIGKTRGEKAGLEAMLKYVEKHPPDYEWGVEYGHSNALKSLIKNIEFFRSSIPELKSCRSFISGLGPVVGTHVGPGMIAIGYIGEEK